MAKRKSTPNPGERRREKIERRKNRKKKSERRREKEQKNQESLFSKFRSKVIQILQSYLHQEHSLKIVIPEAAELSNDERVSRNQRERSYSKTGVLKGTPEHSFIDYGYYKRCTGQRVN